MKKFLLHPVMVTTIVLVVIFSLPFVITKEDAHLDDKGLREAAARHNLTPVPKDAKERRKAVQNPQNPLSLAKIDQSGTYCFFRTDMSGVGR